MSRGKYNMQATIGHPSLEKRAIACEQYWSSPYTNFKFPTTQNAIFVRSNAVISTVIWIPTPILLAGCGLRGSPPNMIAINPVKHTAKSQYLDHNSWHPAPSSHSSVGQQIPRNDDNIDEGNHFCSFLRACGFMFKRLALTRILFLRVMS